MERFDVFVIGGGGTGSEVAFSLARTSGLKVALAERDKLGGRMQPLRLCSHQGDASIGEDRERSLGTPSDSASGSPRSASTSAPCSSGPVTSSLRSRGKARSPSNASGVRVFLQEARLIGEHRVELADGTEIEADKVVLATGTDAAVPPIPGLADGPFWTNREAIWEPEAPPESLAVIGTGAIGIEFAQIYARFGVARDRARDPSPRPSSGGRGGRRVDRARSGGRRDRAAVPTCGSSRLITTAPAWTLHLQGKDPLIADELLVATGRRPMFDPHDLAAAGVELDGDGNAVLTGDASHHEPRRLGRRRRDG